MCPFSSASPLLPGARRKTCLGVSQNAGTPVCAARHGPHPRSHPPVSAVRSPAQLPGQRAVRPPDSLRRAAQKRAVLLPLLLPGNPGRRGTPLPPPAAAAAPAPLLPCGCHRRCRFRPLRPRQGAGGRGSRASGSFRPQTSLYNVTNGLTIEATHPAAAASLARPRPRRPHPLAPLLLRRTAAWPSPPLAKPPAARQPRAAVISWKSLRPFVTRPWPAPPPPGTKRRSRCTS